MSISLRKVCVFGRFPFVRIIQVLQNPRFLKHLLLKNIFYKRISEQRYKKLYDRIRFLDEQESLEKIIEGYSIARFSDGEIGILCGAGIYPPDSDWSQRWSKRIKQDLERVLKSSRSNLLIAVEPPETFLATKDSVHDIPFFWNMWVDTRRLLHQYLNPDISYGHCHLFLQANAPKFDWRQFRDFTRGRDIVVVSGSVENLSHYNIGKSTYFVEVSKDDAYERKDSIKVEIYKVIREAKLNLNDVTVMLCLGPTACVLAYEMDDVQVLDTGHIFEFATEGFIEHAFS